MGLRVSPQEELSGLDLPEHGLASAYADFMPSPQVMGVGDFKMPKDYKKEEVVSKDDAIPVNSFYFYCEQMLNYYKDNEKIEKLPKTALITNKKDVLKAMTYFHEGVLQSRNVEHKLFDNCGVGHTGIVFKPYDEYIDEPVKYLL